MSKKFLTPTRNERARPREEYLGGALERSFLVIGTTAKSIGRSTRIANILYMDEKPCAHYLHGQEVAQHYANTYSRPVYYFLESLGATVQGWAYPAKRKVQSRPR